MQRVLSGDLARHVGARVRVAGWLHHQRRLSKLTFVVLRDRSGLAQIVVSAPDVVRRVGTFLPETDVEATVAVSEQAPGGVELHDPFERFTARLTSVANVRETTLFPRDRSRLTP